MTPKQKAIEIIETEVRCATDELCGVEDDFLGYSPEQMEKEYSHTGLNCYELLATHEREVDECQAALDWVKSQPETEEPKT